MKGINLRGIIPAIVLPMTRDFQPDLAALRRYVDWLVPQRPVALAVNVDTGEGPHLSFEERRTVLESVVKAVNGRCKVVAGVAGPYTAQAVRNAQSAKDAGADALLVFPISVFQGTPLKPEVPYAYHRAIADAVDMPLILFQLQPALGGIVFGADALSKLLEIEQVVAIKEAAFDAKLFLQTKALLDAAPRHITFLTGNDNIILESFIMGAEGALLGFSTIATDLQVQMMQAALENDYDTAWSISYRLQPLSDTIFMPPVTDYRARTKEALRLLGVLENNVVRPPLLPLSVEECAAVRRALVRAELLGG
jgi:dihydrodipicolinate synthase/N-acetylneuraminate lyase